jgi:hypothetical protein
LFWDVKKIYRKYCGAARAPDAGLPLLQPGWSAGKLQVPAAVRVLWQRLQETYEIFCPAEAAATCSQTISPLLPDQALCHSFGFSSLCSCSQAPGRCG